MAGKFKLTGKIEIKARKMLRDVCAVLNDNSVPYTLEGGTLLGIIREQRLLPWDNDMDLTLTEDDLRKFLNVIPEISRKGYRVRIRKFLEDTGPLKQGNVRLIKVSTRQFFFFKGMGLLDIFIKYRSGNEFYWTVSSKKPVLKSAPSHFYENLTEYNFDGYGYSVPERYEDYLSYRYGDWKTPVKEYNFRKDDKAIVNNGEKQ